ncbi:substrate-binding periplasmic protein [Algicola sagamiensis]|uniref:substrate-binding periplasmic protein n=1 Tax=Algicola sagamiensis TaxID=163869 RepID=UPI00035EFB76|nr:transporter substrate-binding domain-containing protein [Algicola sagamiensis]
MHRFFLCVFVLYASLVKSADLTDLEYITEHYPPYNFKEKGQLRGIAVELLELASRAKGPPVLPRMVNMEPWARGYQKVLKGRMKVLFSMTRTPKREKLFLWAGPITDTRVVVLAKKGREIKITSPDQFKLYTIGVVRDDIGEQSLNTLGIEDKHLQLSPFPEVVAKKLHADRVDMWAYEARVAQWVMRQLGINTNAYEEVYVLTEGHLYFSFSSDVNDEYVADLQEGIDEIRKAGRLEEILAKYR